MQTSTRSPLTEHISANTNIQRRQAGKYYLLYVTSPWKLPLRQTPCFSFHCDLSGNGGSFIKPSDATPTKLTNPGGRIFETKQAIAAIHGKKFPVRGNNSNLVINFSDDDSGSESDCKGRTQTSKIQPKGTISGNRNPSTFSQTKLKGPRQIDIRAITKKALSTSTFSHAATSKVSNLSFAKEMKSNKYIHSSERTVSKDAQRPEQIVESNSNKLQDLKQQIALRESELKLKAAQPKKDAVNPKITPARRVSIISDDTRHLEPNEPPKKRLKVSGIDTSQPVIDYRVAASAAAPMNAPDIRKSLLPGESRGKH